MFPRWKIWIILCSLIAFRIKHALSFPEECSQRHIKGRKLYKFFLASVGPCCSSKGLNSAGGLLLLSHSCSQNLLYKEKGKVMCTATSIHMHVEETTSCDSISHYALLYSTSGWAHIAGIFCHSHCATHYTEVCGKFPWNWWHGKLPYFRIDIRAFRSLWRWNRNQCPKVTHEAGRQLCEQRSARYLSSACERAQR